MRILVLLIFSTGLIQAQSLSFDTDLKRSVNGLRLFNLGLVEEFLASHDTSYIDVSQKHTVQALDWKYRDLQFGNRDSIRWSKGLEYFRSDSSSVNAAVYRLYYGDYIIAAGANHAVAYAYYESTKQIGERLNDPLLICEALKRQVKNVNDRGNDYETLKHLSQEYLTQAFDSYEEDLSTLHYWRAKSLIDKYPYINEFLAGEAQALMNGNEIIRAYYLKLIGVKYEYYSDVLIKLNISFNNYEKALNAYNKSLELYALYEPANFAVRQKVGLLINKGITYYVQEKFDSAQLNLRFAKKYLDSTDYHSKFIYYQWSANNKAGLKQFDSAFHYKYIEDSLRRKFSKKQIDLSVAEIYSRFETEKKQRQIETQKATITLNTSIQIISTILLLVIITLLILRFRAIRVATIKDKKLHSQEINQLIANQELRMIQAVIEGEEKERERVAEDLHDRLGSTLSATRMHFDVLEENMGVGSNSQAARIKFLIDKAIEDTRQISHNLLSGVLTKFGLKAAVEDLKETVMSANSLEVQTNYGRHVFSFTREVEVQIFRIIQELMSNALKHAHAEKVKISLKQTKNSHQLFFKDDGLGFDVNLANNGIGLKNIQSRLHKINASWSINSDESGTEIIINLPI